jgi:hypothetical protein
VLQEIDGSIADDRLEKGQQLEGRPAAKVRETASIERRQGVREDVVRVSDRQTKRA